jgi:hypothetical protein
LLYTICVRCAVARGSPAGGGHGTTPAARLKPPAPHVVCVRHPPCIVRGLESGRVYAVTARAHSLAGWGPPSPPVDMQTSGKRVLYGQLVWALDYTLLFACGELKCTVERFMVSFSTAQAVPRAPVAVCAWCLSRAPRATPPCPSPGTHPRWQLASLGTKPFVELVPNR